MKTLITQINLVIKLFASPCVFAVFFMHLFLVAGCTSNHVAKNSDYDLIKAKVTGEFLALNSNYHKRYILKFTDSASRASYPNEMFINLKKIKTYTQNIPADQAIILIRLVVAHEFVHLLQYENPLFYNNGQAYRIRILEAQADILAARYAVLKHRQENSNSKNDHSLIESYNEKKFIVAYQLFFKLGYATNSLVDHPTKYERASCVYRGVRCARMEIFTTKLTKERKLINNKTELRSLDSTVKAERESLNITNSYNPLDWSWEQAQLICHGNPAYMPDFIRMHSNIDTLRNKKGQARGLILYQYFANDSFEDIDVTMEFRAAPMRKYSTPFFKNIEFEQAKYHRYHLKPFHTATTSDIFQIPKEKGDFEVIVPPDTSSLYYVVASKKNRPEVQKKIDDMSLDSTLERSTLKDYLIKINKAIHDVNIAPIIVSAGMPANIGTDFYSQYFTGIVPLNEKFSSVISYDARYWRQYLVKLTFKDTQDSLSAIREFERWTKTLSQIMPLEKAIPKNISVIVWQPNYLRSVAFKSKEYPGNYNYLYLERRMDMEMQFHPFTRIKGDTDGVNEKSTLRFSVYLVVRKPPNLSLWRSWPRTYVFNAIVADN